MAPSYKGGRYAQTSEPRAPQTLRMSTAQVGEVSTWVALQLQVEGDELSVELGPRMRSAHCEQDRGPTGGRLSPSWMKRYRRFSVLSSSKSAVHHFRL